MKHNPDGSQKPKSRLVARGFSQKPGIDYQETYSPVSRIESIRVLISISAQEDLEMKHFDVRTAILYGALQEELYMQQPPGYGKNPNLVCQLQKAI